MKMKIYNEYFYNFYFFQNSHKIFFQYLDNDGKGGDDCFEFTAKDQSCIQFNIHQPEDDEIRCYLRGDWDNDEVPEDKIDMIDTYLSSI